MHPHVETMTGAEINVRKDALFGYFTSVLQSVLASQGATDLSEPQRPTSGAEPVFASIADPY